MNNFSGQQFGGYRLIRLEGSGGFADVYLAKDERATTAEDQQLKAPVALKVLKDRLSDEVWHKFIEEAHMLHLKHPNIVETLDFGVAYINGFARPFIVMAYAPGGNLLKRHPKGTQVPLSTVVSYVKQLAAALDYLHTFPRKKLVHCDVKPENMLVAQVRKLPDAGNDQELD